MAAPGAPWAAALEAYRRKRDFTTTPEPTGGESHPRVAPSFGADARSTPADGATAALRFSVQAHAARRMHFDLRLELDGVLKSWAVPNGFSADPRQKRLAVMTEDHPLQYLTFEGIIPRGHYGAGEMIVWDGGTYWAEEDGLPPPASRAVAEERARRGLAAGKLKLTFAGRKLRGTWNLVRTARGPADWLLIRRAESALPPNLDDHRSTISGLTLEDLKSGRRPVATRSAALAREPGATAAPFPQEMAPMTATAAERPFAHPDWLFEPKLDGYRVLAFVDGGRVTLLSRRGLDATRDYPMVADELCRQPRRMVLDGEVVALDERGRPTFAALQARLEEIRRQRVATTAARLPLLYYVFDLLYLDGHDLRGVPLERRKELLREALVAGPAVRPVEHIATEGTIAYQAAIGLGLEGLVAKQRRSVYESGRRSAHWLKLKGTLGDELVVGGYTRGNGARATTIGALLVGQYDDGGRLRYLGHVGTGFDDDAAADLRRRLDALAADASPFAEPVLANAPPTWARPELVVEVTYAGVGAEGHLRFPVFARVREDKPAAETRRVEVVAPPVGDPLAGNPIAGNPLAGNPLAGAVAAPPAEDPLAGNPLLGAVAAVLAQLAGRETKLQLEVDGRRIGLTNLNKELWPGRGDVPPVTKRDLLIYLARASPFMLPHLRDRPLTLIRMPNGVGGQRFYQKHWTEGRPPFVDTVVLHSEHNGGDEELLLCNNLATLLWLGQSGALEIHAWYSRVSAEPDGGRGTTAFAGSLENLRGSLLNYPDWVAFDLDPVRPNHADAPAFDRGRFARVCDAAHWLRELLDSLKLGSFVKTTGRSGLHVYVPIERRLDYDATRSVSQTIAQFLRRAHPKEITAEVALQRRTGDVFVDWNQNVRGKTLAAVYSPRATAEATVSMPLRWDEVGTLTPPDLTLRSAPERLARLGDVWRSIPAAKADLAAQLGLQV